MTRKVTILVVDDDAELLEMIATILQTCGFGVLTAESGMDALSRLQENPGAINLVMTDFLMPSLSGARLIREIRQQYPDMPILVISGFGSLIDNLPARVTTIEKPIAFPLLLDTVQSLLFSAHG